MILQENDNHCLAIVTDSSANSSPIQFKNDIRHREERRPWELGMNLRLFLEAGGVYPTHPELFAMIDEMEIIGDKIDLGPANLILNNGKINLIDQHDHQDILDTKEQLKNYLLQGADIPNMTLPTEINA